MVPSLKLKHFTKADIDGTVKFFQKQFIYASNLPFYKTLREHFNMVASNREDYHFWVLKDESGKVVGGIGLTTVKGNPSSRRWWIDCFAIDSRYRGNGFGKRMMKHIERKVLKLGIRKLNIYTSTSRHERAANLLYERFGYKVIGEFPEREANGTRVTALFRQKHF